MSIQLLIPRSSGSYQPVRALPKATHPILLSRSDVALWLLHIDFLLECAVEVGRGDVKLNDTKVANVCQGEDGAEGSQTHYGRNRFPVINTRTLVVVTSNDPTLSLLKDAIIELLMKCPTEFEGPHAIHRGTSS